MHKLNPDIEELEAVNQEVSAVKKVNYHPGLLIFIVNLVVCVFNL